MPGKVISLEDLRIKVESLANEPFKQYELYHKESDSMHIQWQPGPYIRERVDGRLTIFRSPSGAVIGAQFKGFQAMYQSIKSIPGIKIQRGYNAKLKVGYLLAAVVVTGKVLAPDAPHYLECSAKAFQMDNELVTC